MRILVFLWMLVASSVYAQEWMPDKNLREIIVVELGIETLDITDMTNLYELISVERSEITNLEGLQHAVNLEFLHIGRAMISDISVLASLENLHTLKLHNNEIVDISALSGLHNLKELQLQNNKIRDFTPLMELPQLEYLNTKNNLAVFYSIDEFCVLSRPTYTRSVADRLENRSYPIGIHFTCWYGQPR